METVKKVYEQPKEEVVEVKMTQMLCASDMGEPAPGMHEVQDF